MLYVSRSASKLESPIINFDNMYVSAGVKNPEYVKQSERDFDIILEVMPDAYIYADVYFMSYISFAKWCLENYPESSKRACKDGALNTRNDLVFMPFDRSANVRIPYNEIDNNFDIYGNARKDSLFRGSIFDTVVGFNGADYSVKTNPNIIDVSNVFLEYILSDGAVLEIDGIADKHNKFYIDMIDGKLIHE